MLSLCDWSFSLSLFLFSHSSGYETEASAAAPVVYSCSAQYHIHTHGVFRGIQVGDNTHLSQDITSPTLKYSETPT